VVQTEEQILCDSERLVDTYHDPARYSMCRISIAPCSPFSVTPEEMRQAAVWARERGLTLHTHVAETLDEERFCLQKFGKRPVALMEALGWLGPDVWFAHCVHLNESEIALMAETGTGVAHCPSSNMRLGSGIAPIREMRDAGVRVGLAVDGSASNDASHMLAEARQAMLLQRVTKGATAMGAVEALEIATRGGAETLCRDDIGVLSPGMAADFVGWRLDALDYAGAQHAPLAALLFCTPRVVDLSVINGQVVVRSGQMMDTDVPRLVARHNEISRNMIEQA
ncbi:MAG: amidohydrolase family protein, partial [Anaerolineae bacterium]|nr:amidohydrolase family protein [Anaerolineae bacterium]